MGKTPLKDRSELPSEELRLPREPAPKLSATPQFLFVNFCLFALLAVITVSVTTLYVSSEHNFHWWIDWYHRTLQVANAFRESPNAAIEQVRLSLGQDRNKIYTLPLVPFILLFGDSRLVYQLSLAFVYLLPFSLCMGAISTQLIRANQFLVFWSTALLTLLIPVTWVATFLGIPDTGGALLIGLAVLVYLRDYKLKQWWHIPLIGFLIALAIMLRRHFIYGGIAFFSAATLQTLLFFCVEVQKHSRKAWRDLLLVITRICLIAIISITTLLTVTWEFSYRALTTDYRSLYTSWSLPFSTVVWLYASFYGWATWLLVAIGFTAGVMTRALALPAVSFIGLFSLFSLIEWLVILRYGNIFYTLHITPFIVLGSSAFLWTTWRQLTGKVRTLLLGLASFYLISNLIVGLTPLGSFNNSFRPLFALSIPPLVRPDYDEAVRLVETLRKLAPNKEPIYIVGYQRLQLTSSMVKAAERVLYGVENGILNILVSPQVDSQDFYPLETLLQAQYVVIPNPLPNFQGDFANVPLAGEWLPAKEHDVVNVVFDAFTQNWEIAQDFQRLPLQFDFAENSVIHIYRRIRPTSLGTAVRTLTQMQQQIGQRPGGQLDWITLNQLNNSSVSKNADGSYKLVNYKSDFIDNQKTSFLYLGTLPEKAEITGTASFYDQSCSRASIRLATLNKEGQVSSTVDEDLANNSNTFKLASSQKADYLLLDIWREDKNDSIKYCLIVINSLIVNKQQ